MVSFKKMTLYVLVYKTPYESWDSQEIFGDLSKAIRRMIWLNLRMGSNTVRIELFEEENEWGSSVASYTHWYTTFDFATMEKAQREMLIKTVEITHLPEEDQNHWVHSHKD